MPCRNPCVIAPATSGSRGCASRPRRRSRVARPASAPLDAHLERIRLARSARRGRDAPSGLRGERLEDSTNDAWTDHRVEARVPFVPVVFALVVLGELRRQADAHVEALLLTIPHGARYHARVTTA